MKRVGPILLACLLVVGLLSAAPSRAEACGPMVETGDYRTYAEEIFVARVLEQRAVENATATDGQRVTLYELTAYVEDTLKGSANTGQLVTVYVVSAYAPGAEEAADGTVTYPVYNLPEVPEALASYIFFARAFGDAAYVLNENSAPFVEMASNDALDRARVAVAQAPAYIY